MTGTPVSLQELMKQSIFNGHYFLLIPLSTMIFFLQAGQVKLKSPRNREFKIGLDGNDGYRFILNNKLIIDNWKKQTYSTLVNRFHFEKGKEYDIRIEFFEPVGNAMSG